MNECRAKFLGWANGWKQKPPEIEASKQAGHNIQETSDGRGITYVKCAEGGWYYKIDSTG